MSTDDKQPIKFFNTVDGTALGVVRYAHLDPDTLEIVAIGVELSNEQTCSTNVAVPASELNGTNNGHGWNAAGN